MLQSDASTYLPAGRSILMYGLVFYNNFQCFTVTLIVIFNFLKRKNVEMFFKLLRTFDDHTDKMGWKFKVNHERNYWISIFWTVLQMLSLSIGYSLQLLYVPIDEPDLLEFISMIFYCILSNTLMLTSLQFIFSVQCVESRLDILNKNTR